MTECVTPDLEYFFPILAIILRFAPHWPYLPKWSDLGLFVSRPRVDLGESVQELKIRFSPMVR